MKLLCIDPGLSGGIAVLLIEGGRREVLHACDIPTRPDGSNRQVDVAAVCGLIEKFNPDDAVIENVGAMPSIPGPDGERRSMGAASSFRFGFAVGQIRAVCECYGLDPKLIVPRVWKNHFGLKGSQKGQSRDTARRLCPSALPFLTLKMHHGRAEAILMGLYVADKRGMI